MNTFINIAFAALHVLPPGGGVNVLEVPELVRTIQATSYSTVANQELAAINRLRAEHGLRPINEQGEEQ